MEKHIPVLLKEVASRLLTQPAGIYLDGTIGSGGHSEYLLKNFSGIQIIGLDVDAEMVERAKKRLQEFGSRVRVYRSNFRDAKKVLEELKIPKVSGVLLDLGISSEQLDSCQRGFSYRKDCVLDMRFDRSQLLNAKVVVNEYPQKILEEIFREFGQEKFAGRIARAIVSFRQKQQIEKTQQLVRIIEESIPRYRRKFHPARRVFQSLRIFVNEELKSLKQFLEILPEILLPQARAVIISYHSGEDRLVKASFRQGVQNNIYRIVPPFLIRPTEEEIKNNPRSRSARMRTVERI